MNNNEWDFIDKFNVREAAVAAVGCSIEVVDILPDDWSCDEQVKKSKLFIDTAKKIQRFEIQFIRAARAYVELGVVGELEFFKPDGFKKTDFAYSNQVYISRESLRSLFEKRNKFPKAFQEVTKFEVTDTNYFYEILKANEAKIELLKEKKTLGVSGVIASNLVEALCKMIINPTSQKFANQGQLITYIINNFKGTGLNQRNLDELFARKNELSSVVKKS